MLKDIGAMLEGMGLPKRIGRLWRLLVFTDAIVFGVAWISYNAGYSDLAMFITIVFGAINLFFVIISFIAILLHKPKKHVPKVPHGGDEKWS